MKLKLINLIRSGITFNPNIGKSGAWVDKDGNCYELSQKDALDMVEVTPIEGEEYEHMTAKEDKTGSLFQ